jgi:ribosomal protein S18 acetylase RimI-like enzyme
MREEHDAVPEADPEGAVAGWSERLRSQISRRQVILAARGPDVVGFVAFLDSDDRSWIPREVAYVVDLYVLPDARHASAARLLFEALLHRVGPDHKQIWTNTSRGNQRVQVLLHRAGFSNLVGFEIPGLGDQLYFKKEMSGG